MDLIGLVSSITTATTNIDFGRKGFATRGKAEEGRISSHIACISHKTRLQNILRSPGIDPIEKDLLKQWFTNLSAAQGAYIEIQKKAVKK